MRLINIEQFFEKGIYCRQTWEINTEPHYYDFKIGNENQIIVGIDQLGGRYFCAVNGRYYEKDYGKTWAFTKEELL